MADKHLHITVITPSKAVLDTAAAAVVAPAFDGELGVLPGHAAMLALLGTGVLNVTLADGQARKLAIRGGFLQIENNKVTVLTPQSAAAEELKADALQTEAGQLDAQKPTKIDEREMLETNRKWLATRQRLLQNPSALKH